MAVHSYLCADQQTYSIRVDRPISENSISNPRMGVTLVASSRGYLQPALPAGPSGPAGPQETSLLASSDVVDKDPEWKARW